MRVTVTLDGQKLLVPVDPQATVAILLDKVIEKASRHPTLRRRRLCRSALTAKLEGSWLDPNDVLAEVVKDGETVAVKSEVEDEPEATDSMINIKVVGPANPEVQFRVKKSTQLRKVMTAYCDRMQQDMKGLQFLYGSERIRPEQTPAQLEMKDGDIIDALVKSVGDIGVWDIGVWASHTNREGVQFLQGQVASRQDAQQLLQSYDAEQYSHFQIHTGDAVGERGRRMLMEYADAHHQGEQDLKLDFSLRKLSELLGATCVNKLVALFPATISKVKVRRVQPASGQGHCIGFHKDVSNLTMQIALNSDCQYSGGKLVFVTAEGLQQPKRPAGLISIHDSTILHGVTRHITGVRYSLFFLNET